ncbi:MAG: hypothetical protein HYZ18_00775 [Pseudogulbenkiania sp.]|nr:hypothetical protein [Pseudogulbenkiania sp.]
MELNSTNDADVIGSQPARMIPWVDRLLEKWARWKSADGWHGGGCGVSSLLLTEHREIDRAIGQRDSPDDLMLDLDAAVVCLPDDLIKVVVERYERGGLMEQKAAALGISKRTLEYRLGKIHQAIQSALDIGPDKVPLLRVKWYAARSCVAKQKRLAA